MDCNFMNNEPTVGKEQSETTKQQDSPVTDFYTGKSILITGGTGFIGKVLIEKLLSSCPAIDRIYLLIRAAKGRSPQERLLDMIQQRPFSMRLKTEFVAGKLVAVPSDLSEPNLGISELHMQPLVERVSVLFHVAASVKFEAPLEMNMLHNVVATKELLEFACRFRGLLSFVHVSTAYSNCQLKFIEERVYPMPVPEDPMALQVTKEMIDNRPNTYTYTKAMAENVVCQYADRLNIVIVRPSIVMSALREPAQGWVDTINGPVGLSVLGALGILQKIKVNSEVVFDLIPVDLVTNALLTIAWASVERRREFPAVPEQPEAVAEQRPVVAAAEQCKLPAAELQKAGKLPPASGSSEQQRQPAAPDNSVRVFNLTTGDENPCSFYQYFSTGRDEAYLKPSLRALRPLLHIPKQKGMNAIQYWIHKVFSHLLFAYIVDTLLSLFGQKKMVVKAVKRMHHANEMFDYFCSNQWHFVTDNVKRLRKLQTISDRSTYHCDVRSLNWEEYARIGWLGCRRYILKEEDDTFELAQRRYRKICLMYYMVKLILLLLVTSFAKTFITSTILLSAIMMPIYGVVYLL